MAADARVEFNRERLQGNFPTREPETYKRCAGGTNRLRLGDDQQNEKVREITNAQKKGNASCRRGPQASRTS